MTRSRKMVQKVQPLWLSLSGMIIHIVISSLTICCPERINGDDCSPVTLTLAPLSLLVSNEGGRMISKPQLLI